MAFPSSLLPRARSRALIPSLSLPFRTPATQATYPASIQSNFQYIVVSFVTWLLRLAWLVCRSDSYYTTLHDWVIKWFQTRWQKWAAFKTHKKCGRQDLPLRLRRSRKSLAASSSPRVAAPPPKKYPGQKNPASYAGYSPKYKTHQRARSRGVTRAVFYPLIWLANIKAKGFTSRKSFCCWG